MDSHLVPWVTWARNFCAQDQSHACNMGEPGHFFLCATSHANLPLIAVCKIQISKSKGHFERKSFEVFRLASSTCWAKPALKRLVPLINNVDEHLHLHCVLGSVVLLNVLGCRLAGTSWDQCRSTVQYCFKSMETLSLVRTDSPGQPPRLSHSPWTMAVFFKPIIIMKIHNKMTGALLSKGGYVYTAVVIIVFFPWYSYHKVLRTNTWIQKGWRTHSHHRPRFFSFLFLYREMCRTKLESHKWQNTSNLYPPPPPLLCREMCRTKLEIHKWWKCLHKRGKKWKSLPQGIIFKDHPWERWQKIYSTHKQ